MGPDRVSNPGPLTYESGALPIALRGPANFSIIDYIIYLSMIHVHSLSSKSVHVSLIGI